MYDTEMGVKPKVYVADLFGICVPFRDYGWLRDTRSDGTM
jgi:hypothetical protein